MDAVNLQQYMLEQLKIISSGISRKDLSKIGVFHRMDKRNIMGFFSSNFEFLSTLPLDEISQFIKIALFIMFEKYMQNQSTRNAMGTKLFQAFHSEMNLDSPEDDSISFIRDYKSPCFNLLCLLYSKISAQIRPKTQEEYRQVKQDFIDMVKSLVPDIHYLMTEKYPTGCPEIEFFFGRKPDMFETLGLFQLLFFEITSHEFKTVIFLEENRIYVRTVQIFFNEIHATLQKV